jgi:hypothetical protein
METLSWPSHVDAEFLGERRHTPNVAVHKKEKNLKLIGHVRITRMLAVSRTSIISSLQYASYIS